MQLLIILLYFYYSKMISEESSVRDMFQFPNASQQHKGRKYQMRGHRSKRLNHQGGKPQKWNFMKVVKAIKNVTQFVDNLKQKREEKGAVNEHSLKPNEIEYLQNDSQNQGQTAFFQHDNRLILLTDILFITSMLLYFWQCTYQMVLGLINDNQTINSIALSFYLLHIVLQQVTQLKNEKSQLITKLSQLREIYKRQKLMKDVISITVLALQITPYDNQQSNAIFFIAIRLLSLLAHVQMSATCQKVEQTITLSIFGQTIISFLKLLYKVFIFLHLISIFLNWVATMEHQYGITDTWLDGSNISYSSNFEKYILGWYWGATILSTVGFGDITPGNNLERFIVSIIQVCCCMSFGYFINTIGQMIKVRQQSSQKYVKEVRSLNRFLSLLTISNDLKHKIRTHYFNKNQVQSMNDPKQEKLVLQTITPNLKTSLLEEVNLKIIKKCSQLQKFRSETIRKIAQILKRTILAPEYLLYSRNSSDHKIWLIEDGSVEEFTDHFSNSKLKKIISVYNNNQPLVGWINFVTHNLYKTLAKAKNFTVAHELEQVEFMKCIKQDERDFLKFAETKQLLIEKNKKYDSKCISCGRYTHNVINCPRIHLIKRDGYKLAKRKILLEDYKKQQTPKPKRSQYSYKWKKMYSNGYMQKELKECHLLLNQSIQAQNPALSGTIEKFLNNYALRDSVICAATEKEKRKASVLVINNRQIEKSFDDRSRPSDYEQQIVIQLDKMLITRQNNDYFPKFNVQNVLNNYYKNKKNNTFRKKATFSSK